MTSLLCRIRPVHCPLTILVPYNFRTIQEAVDNATAGDTIQVDAGIYPEHVVVTKSLTIIGENPQTTIVDGTANGTVFYLDASNINITGFTVCNGGNNSSGIASEKALESDDYHWIANNIITTSAYGVYLSRSNRNTIFNNTFIDNPFTGIGLNHAFNNNITANTIIDSTYGMRIMYSTNNAIIGNNISQTSYAVHLTLSSTENTIRRNILSATTAGIYSSSDSITVDHNTIEEGAHGVYFYNCKYGSIYYNTFMNKHGTGIRIYMSTPAYSSHNISNNKILYTDWAIDLVSAHNNTFTGNWLEQNTYGIYMYFSSYNTAYHNNFIENNMQAYGTGAGNLWDKDGEGNYWSDYQGEDAMGDGIGDTPYMILPPDSGSDNFPLMNTWSEHDISIQSITVSVNETNPGTIVDITVTVQNIANITVSENFTVTAKYDLNIIETKTVNNLAQGATQTLTFNWNTTGVASGNYTIKAEASEVPDELNTGNNDFIDGTVKITEPILGDINVDGTVNDNDLIILVEAYGSTPTSSNWNQDADLNNDDIINVLDLSILSKNYGKTT